MDIGRISTLDGTQSADIAYTLNVPARTGVFADGEAVPAEGIGFPVWLKNVPSGELKLRLADGRALMVFISSTTGRGFNAPPLTDTFSFYANAGFEE
jgi:hypothetical protein